MYYEKFFITRCCCQYGVYERLQYQIIEEVTDRRMTWTSTCNISHVTHFPDSWHGEQIAQWVSDQNIRECAVKPRNVYVDLSPDMLRIVVEE